MYICEKCGRALTKHTKTEAGSQRYCCKPCGIKPFVPPELKKQNDNPPCPKQECEYYGKNDKVQKLYKIKDSGKQRYRCTSCNKSFMKLDDYVPKKIIESIEPVESRLPKDDYEKLIRKLTTKMNRALLRESNNRSSDSMRLTVNRYDYDEFEEPKKKKISSVEVKSDSIETDPFEGMDMDEIFRFLPGEIVSRDKSNDSNYRSNGDLLGYKDGVFDINLFLDSF